MKNPNELATPTTMLAFCSFNCNSLPLHEEVADNSLGFFI